MTFTGFPKDVVDVTTASASGYWLHEVSQIERQMALQVAQRRLRVADSFLEVRRVPRRRLGAQTSRRAEARAQAVARFAVYRAHRLRGLSGARARPLSHIAVRLEPRG